MADNVAITPGTGNTIAADEVIDDDLGTAKVQYVKLMDGTIDGTEKAVVTSDGLKVKVSNSSIPVTDNGGSLTVDAASLPLPTGAATSAKQDTIIGHVDGIESVLGTIDADTGNIATSAASIDTKLDTLTTPSDTQPISAATLPLPSGASTSAKQPALGTAGTASADVITVQGIASMTPLKTDASATTQPVSASSLPLPTGAATAAKQPALGTAGSASADVITVQGVASMTALKTDGSAVTQPVSNAGLTELAAAINSSKLDVNIASSDVATGGTSAADDADFTAGTTAGTPAMGVYESSPTSVTDGDLGTIGITQGRRLKTSSTIDAALPAGTNNIGDVDVVSSALPTGASTSAKQDTIIGHVDGIEGLLTTIDADTGNIATSAAGISTKLDDNSQTTQIVDAAGNAVTVTGNKLDVNASASLAGETLPIAAATEAVGVAVVDGDGNQVSDFATQTTLANADSTLTSISADTNTIATTVPNLLTETAFTNVVTSSGNTAPGASLQASGVDGSGNAQPIATNTSGHVSINDGGNTITVDGTVTANAGTNLNTSALALESGGNLAGAATSLAVIDDWDESDRAKVNPIVGQAGVQGGSGAVSNTTQRVVLATDVALPAGTNAIGKLASNSGVDVGDVTINNSSSEPVFVASIKSSSAASTSTGVSVGNTSTTVLASNASRRKAIIVNDSDEVVYLKLGSSAASASGIRLNASGGTYIEEYYTGIITGICASGSKNVTVTELQ